jgi:hypothetical protein
METGGNLQVLDTVQEKTRSVGGRPKGAKTKQKHYAAADAARVYALRHAEMAVRRLAILAEKAESEAAAVSACKEILDRAYGKAPQAIVGEDGGPIRNEVIVRIIEAGIGARHPSTAAAIGYSDDEV